MLGYDNWITIEELPMLHKPLLLLNLMTAPSAECSEEAIRALFRGANHTGAVALSKRCYKATGDAYYQFSAAQAYFYLEDFPRARDALQQFFAGTDKTGDHSDSAHSLQAEVDAVLAGAAQAKPAPRPRPSPSPVRNELPRQTAPTPEVTTPSATTADPPPPAPPLTTPKSFEEPVQLDEPMTAEPAPGSKSGVRAEVMPLRPDFRRGWIGLGVAAGVLAVGSAASGVSGGLVARDALHKNDESLADHGIAGGFDPANCADIGSDACGIRDLEENGYSSAKYHRDLVLASRLLSASTVAGGAALGGLLGAAPIVDRSQRRRRVAILVAIAGGGLVTAGGAIFYGLSRPPLGDALRGFDDGGPWRVSRSDFMRLEGSSAAAGVILGFGAGTLVGASLAALAEWRPQTKNRRAQIKVLPGLGSLSLVGRF